MKRLGEGGIYATFVADVEEGQMYKYMLVLADGRRLYKADPVCKLCGDAAGHCFPRV